MGDADIQDAVDRGGRMQERTHHDEWRAAEAKPDVQDRRSILRKEGSDHVLVPRAATLGEPAGCKTGAGLYAGHHGARPTGVARTGPHGGTDGTRPRYGTADEERPKGDRDLHVRQLSG